MKRREFIKAGAATATVAGAAGAGGLVGSACGGLFEGNSFDVGRIPLPEMDEYLRKVDDGMQRIAEWDQRGDIPETELDNALENDLGKKALRALFMAGMFGDLPDAGQVHPGMQERVKRSMPEMAEAVAEATEILSSVSEEDAAKLQRYLRDEDNPGMEVAQWLDEMESLLEVSPRRRRQIRAFMTQAVTRLKNQPPRTVFDEYVGRVEKVAGQVSSVGDVERRMIAQIGKQAFFERQSRLAMYAAAWEEAGVTADDLPPVEIPEPSVADGGAEPGPDAGVPPDGGLSDGAVDAGAAPVEQTEQEPAADWEVELSDKTCAQLEHARKQARLHYRDGQYTKSQYGVRDAALRAELARRGCRPVRRDAMGRPLARDGLTAAERRYKLLRAGWVCFGIGVLASGVAVGMMFTDLAIVGAFIATPGVILLLISLFMLPTVYSRYKNV